MCSLSKATSPPAQVECRIAISGDAVQVLTIGSSDALNQAIAWEVLEAHREATQVGSNYDGCTRQESSSSSAWVLDLRRFGSVSRRKLHTCVVNSLPSGPGKQKTDSGSESSCSSSRAVITRGRAAVAALLRGAERK
eukprot:CAMPEP_0115133058 /NCGR_PEP_ID=MMETSP0227-20121206/54164_1 /TAXON_ID=89957 /ORGANISM="Polarella glacialis, Strain CCMP 1383" /LENGTH=136 /DNA_ID=CAMNT_0002539053 /DNA_START=346 /DNA_END=753 /DNA_ORIENTATION=-